MLNKIYSDSNFLRYTGELAVMIHIDRTSISEGNNVTKKQNPLLKLILCILVIDNYLTSSTYSFIFILTLQKIAY
jgi:hypothetical protein